METIAWFSVLAWMPPMFFAVSLVMCSYMSFDCSHSSMMRRSLPIWRRNASASFWSRSRSLPAPSVLFDAAFDVRASRARFIFSTSFSWWISAIFARCARPSSAGPSIVAGAASAHSVRAQRSLSRGCARWTAGIGPVRRGA